MDYLVSEKNQKRMSILLSMPEVQRALKFLQEDQKHSIEEQKELTLIEAPSGYEKDKAFSYAEKLKNLGLSDVQIDGNYNVSSKLIGSDSGEILVEGHLDTVFPFGTAKEVLEENGVLYCPGIYDNTRGIESILAVVRAINVSGLKLKKTVVFGGSTREEIGCVGVGDLLDEQENLEAVLAIDGGFMNGITYNGTIMKSTEYFFHGIGGHAYNSFGLCASAVGAACRTVTKLNELRFPDSPKITFSASQISTPPDIPHNAIPSECRLCINYRGDSQEAFDTIEREVERCVREGCEEETKRWGKDEITFTKREMHFTPGGAQDIHMPLVEAHYLAATALGETVFFRSGGCNNANIAISRGIPAIRMGAASFDLNAHSTKEFFPTKKAYIFPQGILLVLLLAAGVEGMFDPAIDDIKQ